MKGKRKELKNDFQIRLERTLANSKRYIGKTNKRKALADDLGISESRINQYFGSGANLPTTDILKSMSKLLDVDFGYLIGDYDFPRLTAVKLAELSKLTPEAANQLLTYDDAEMGMLNSLIISKSRDTLFDNLKPLLNAIYRYTTLVKSENTDISVSNPAFNLYNHYNGKESPLVLEYQAVEVFKECLHQEYSVPNTVSAVADAMLVQKWKNIISTYTLNINHKIYQVTEDEYNSYFEMNNNEQELFLNLLENEGRYRPESEKELLKSEMDLEDDKPFLS